MCMYIYISLSLYIHMLPHRTGINNQTIIKLQMHMGHFVQVQLYITASPQNTQPRKHDPQGCIFRFSTINMECLGLLSINMYHLSILQLINIYQLSNILKYQLFRPGLAIVVALWCSSHGSCSHGARESCGNFRERSGSPGADSSEKHPNMAVFVEKW